jgi:hypothetical protein
MQALLMLPATSAYTPPHSDVVAVLTRVVANIDRATRQECERRASVMLAHLEGVVDGVHSRLAGREGSVADPRCVVDDLQRLTEMLVRVIIRLLRVLPMVNTARAAALLTRSTTEIGAYQRALVAAAVTATPTDANQSTSTAAPDETEGDQSRPWIGWQKPTLSWLLDGLWLRDPQPALRSRYGDLL